MMSYVLQWLLGFQRLGHEVYFVEKANYENACFDPSRRVMSDDCRFGVAAVKSLLSQIGIDDRFCFVDRGGEYHGLGRVEIKRIFATADLFIDMGTHGAWLPEAAKTGCRVLVDGEPGYTQMKMEQARRRALPIPHYDHFYSHGANIGTTASSAPDVGLAWKHIYSPVVVDEFRCEIPTAGSAFTTIMNWQSHRPIEFDGVVYGQKDIEFQKFIELPNRTSAKLEVAVSGRVPKAQLAANGWQIASAQKVTRSYASFQDYIRDSMGEFSICKNIFVETRTGWFSDRSAAYLASGRPVILQDTGFSAHLPCGMGLYAINSVDDAAAAIDSVFSDLEANSRAAREIACEYLSTSRVLPRLLKQVGL
jgi:hypothetical protein